MIFDWPTRMQQMADFMGFSEEDLELVRASGPILLDRADELTSAVYDHFLQFPQTARFFLTLEGEIDQTRLDRRKHSLARWLRHSIDFRLDEQFPVFLLAMGVVHSNPSLERGYLGSVPARFMIGTMSFAQTAIAGMLLEEMSDPVQALRTSNAWNKLLMLQLDVLLAGYVTETPTLATDPPAPNDDEPDEEPQGMRRVLTNILDGNRANGNANGQSEQPQGDGQ
jgi:hypothetical protein